MNLPMLPPCGECRFFKIVEVPPQTDTTTPTVKSAAYCTAPANGRHMLTDYTCFVGKE